MAKSRKGEKSKAKRAPKLKEAIVLIPLTYNDGTRVPRKLLKAIRREIFVTFHGWTVEGMVKGAYRMRTGEKRVEELQKIAVILDESQLPELEAMVGRWGAQLGQETMLLKIADFVVKFVPPRTEGKEP
jgi:hypothetical protein